MAEQSKFAGALGRLNRSADRKVKHSNEVTGEPAPIRQLEPTNPNRGGKRSNPEYSPTTFFVRKDTKRKATQLLLEEVNEGKDLSDLVEQLLAKWVSDHSHV